LSNEINEQLQHERAKIYKAKRLLEEGEIPLTIQTLKEKYSCNGEEKRYVLQVFDKHNQEMEAIIGKGSSNATVKRYKTVRKLLAEYITKSNHRTDLLLQCLSIFQYPSALRHQGFFPPWVYHQYL